MFAGWTVACLVLCHHDGGGGVVLGVNWLLQKVVLAPKQLFHTEKQDIKRAVVTRGIKQEHISMNILHTSQKGCMCASYFTSASYK